MLRSIMRAPRVPSGLYLAAEDEVSGSELRHEHVVTFPQQDTGLDQRRAFQRESSEGKPHGKPGVQVSAGVQKEGRCDARRQTVVETGVLIEAVKRETPDVWLHMRDFFVDPRSSASEV